MIPTLKKKIPIKEGYGQFYLDRTSEIGYMSIVCENCGRPLHGNVSEVAHIIPKNIFKSVATNSYNCLYLCSNLIYGSDGCHDKYDSSWTAAKSMKVWPLAVQRFEKFEQLITEKNRKTLNHFYGNT